MKAKKTAPLRRRISFAVDRDEIEINSDWVDAVMASPSASAHDPSPVGAFPAPPAAPDGALFFAPDKNSATEEQTSTGEKSATDEECTSVENNSAVDKFTAVERIAAVEGKAPVEQYTTVAIFPTVTEYLAYNQQQPKTTHNAKPGQAVVDNATVAYIATGEQYSTDAQFISTNDHRVARPRPIVRVTDGLTPGQYAVYSLMYEAGESTGGSSRIYKGGYADLGRLTGLSKRGIQNIVADLQAKHVISIHQQPGYHRTETSAYLIPDMGTVLQLWFSKGWRRAVGKSKTLIS
jgi:hypothetical protein